MYQADENKEEERESRRSGVAVQTSTGIYASSRPCAFCRKV